MIKYSLRLGTYVVSSLYTINTYSQSLSDPTCLSGVAQSLGARWSKGLYTKHSALLQFALESSLTMWDLLVFGSTLTPGRRRIRVAPSTFPNVSFDKSRYWHRKCQSSTYHYVTTSVLSGGVDSDSPPNVSFVLEEHSSTALGHDGDVCDVQLVEGRGSEDWKCNVV